YLGGRLRMAGFASLRPDLLTENERLADAGSAGIRFDVTRIARRLIAATEWAARERVPGGRRIILLGASTGAAAALVAAAELPALVSGVAARGGRVDLAGGALAKVVAPVLLVVGSADGDTLLWNRQAMSSLPRGARLAVVPGAGHTFEEPGALGAVGEHVVRWLARPRRRMDVDLRSGAF
ncbi:MAG: dienelactone hydrolase family protein, partial [Gemmatimonadales bacterium]